MSYNVIWRYWDDRRFTTPLVQRLVSRFCLRGYSVPLNLNLHLVELWVRVEGLPIRYSTPEIASTVLSHIGEVTMVDDSNGQFPILYHHFKILVDLSLPLIPGCYFPTINNQVTWVRFNYEGIFRLCKKCGFVGHSKNFCAAEQESITYHLEARFCQLHESSAPVLYSPTDTNLYSNALPGIRPTRSIWTIEVYFGNYDDEDPLENSVDSRPSDYESGGLNFPLDSQDTQSGSTVHNRASVTSIPRLIPPPDPGVFRSSRHEINLESLGSDESNVNPHLANPHDGWRKNLSSFDERIYMHSPLVGSGLADLFMKGRVILDRVGRCGPKLFQQKSAHLQPLGLIEMTRFLIQDPFRAGPSNWEAPSATAAASPSPSLSLSFPIENFERLGYIADSSSNAFEFPLTPDSFAASDSSNHDSLDSDHGSSDSVHTLSNSNTVVPMDFSPPQLPPALPASVSSPPKSHSCSPLRKVGGKLRTYSSLKLRKSGEKMWEWVKQHGPRKRSGVQIKPSTPPLPDDMLQHSLTSGCLPCFLPYKRRKANCGTS
uniref:Zinc knuckle CX2CX4HX4C domain-containing protein n=1 Tax=Chenopodium quinoa TaxID=63459 RepID=A0A803MUJ9_CHEQI